MFRNVMNDLATWYETGADKIAVVRGGKFVGKTWAVADFAMGFFEDHIIIDMDKYPDFAAYAAKERRPEKLHAKLTTSLDKYDFKDKLLIFDNAQNCVGLLGNLVEYSRYNTDCRICVIATSCGPIPGEEECQDDICVYEMMPMNFEEFLKAGKGRKLCAFIENQKITPMPDEVRDSVQTMLETFFVTGGMPEAVDEYYKTGDLRRVDVVLKSILDRTTEYLINSTPKRYLTKVMAIWNSIPVQLTKENKKFMYGYVDPKARAREYEASVDQIVRMGVVRQVYRVRNGVLPLANQKDDKSFELYHLDHGLLRVMAGILVQDIDTDNVLDMMDGVIAEQYALAELYVNRSIGDLYFWISSATAKVDFVYEGDGEVIPVDVQTSPHTKAQSSRVFKHTSLCGQENLSQIAVLDIAGLLFGFSIYMGMLGQVENGEKINAKKLCMSAFHTPAFIASVLGILAGLSKVVICLIDSPFGGAYLAVEGILTTSVTAIILIVVGYSMELTKELIRPCLKTILMRVLLQILMAIGVLWAVHLWIGDNMLLNLAIISYMSAPATFSMQTFLKKEEGSAYVSTTNSMYCMVSILVYIILAAVVY